MSGDSALVLGFLTQSNKPSKNSLICIMRDIKRIARNGKVNPTYVLIPRAVNRLADFLCNWALKYETSDSVFNIAPESQIGSTPP